MLSARGPRLRMNADVDIRIMKRINIIKTPPGEAPQSIRDAWVGVAIPLRPPPFDTPRRFYGVGVLSGPKTLLGQLWALVRGKCFIWEAYSVDALTAVEALAEKSPESAKWWREHTPSLIQPDKRLMFPVEVCNVEE